MFRVIPYRGFEIRVTLTPVERDLYSVTFQITGHNISADNLDGALIKVRHGPFTERWAYLVAEIAGQAAIDVLAGPQGD
ncbi:MULTISPECIES: hypothetical protein [Paraburkholderia]|jgi:hypothetical protein|uniref:Uncharacterized protein n=1 Tax=Paraburkholderia caribensis TaxID=75105 RepID=A0A9Q6S4I3_9BURK|nr:MULTISPECIES: hypothetical protein [Paraburkholderia]ALP66230.1 hypothetical protein AN416_27605 [Paraburkholderia caribensis]AMV45769.1 hypothetical protein ATN79_27880 [Paraburkholderia caribensis]AUT54836.1 hypothetical protein C2L66_23800 [Paraburkholderia caribensis]MCO4877234.1 hypothetical protein [Paraburkholderia caribensis]MDR6383716.1 hypothetical protein [Paraburkholderia caribensis]